MRQSAPSHLQPLALSPMRLVLPVRKVGSLPSFANTRRFAAARAFCWRPLRVAPVEAPARGRASRGQASACVAGCGSVVSLGRPLLLGRFARVTQIRRVPSSAHRCRRIASADSCATQVVCDGGDFASRIPQGCVVHAGACACGARIAGEPQRPNPSLERSCAKSGAACSAQTLAGMNDLSALVRQFVHAVGANGTDIYNEFSLQQRVARVWNISPLRHAEIQSAVRAQRFLLRFVQRGEFTAKREIDIVVFSPDKTDLKYAIVN